MALFPEVQVCPDGQIGYSAVQAIVNRLKGRYGRVFLRGNLLDAAHPVAERRFGYDALVG